MLWMSAKIGLMISTCGFIAGMIWLSATWGSDNKRWWERAGWFIILLTLLGGGAMVMGAAIIQFVQWLWSQLP